MALALFVAGVTGNSQLAGFAALGSLAALYGRLPGHRYRVSVTVLAGLAMTTTVLIVSVAAAQLPSWSVPLVIAALASAARWSCDALRQGPPGAMMPIFAAGAASVPAAGVGEVLTRTAATAIGAMIAVIVAVVVAGWHRSRGLAKTTSWSDLWAGTRRPDLIAPAVLVGLGAAVAGMAADSFGWEHPAWAALGAIAALQGAELRHVGVRALQRGLGTVLGALVAYPLLHAGLGFWALAGCVLALQVITELVVARHYGLAMLTITPMALLMSSMAAPTSAATLAWDRSADTVLGAVVGVLVAVLLAPAAALDRVHQDDQTASAPEVEADVAADERPVEPVLADAAGSPTPRAAGLVGPDTVATLGAAQRRGDAPDASAVRPLTGS